MNENIKFEKKLDAETLANQYFLNNLFETPNDIFLHLSELSESIKATINSIKSDIDNKLKNTDCKIILSGSLAINQFIPSSDYDINLILPRLTSVETAKVQKLFKNYSNDTDLYFYENLSDFINIAKYALMEQNKLSSALYSDHTIENLSNSEIITTDNAKTDFLFTYHLFYNDKYYKKFNQDGFDIKYDYGNVRDFLLINTIGEIENIVHPDSKKPLIESTLHGLHNQNLIGENQLGELLNSVKLLFIIKILFGITNNKNDFSKRINSYSLYTCYEGNEQLFSKIGITTFDQFQLAFYNSKSQIFAFITNYYNNIRLELLQSQEKNNRWQIYELNHQQIFRSSDTYKLDEITLVILKNESYKWENFTSLLQNPNLSSASITLIENYVNLKADQNKFIIAQIKKHPNYEKHNR